jgi:hypothetical protein
LGRGNIARCHTINNAPDEENIRLCAEAKTNQPSAVLEMLTKILLWGFYISQTALYDYNKMI